MVEIQLDLRKYCIETAVRQCHERLISYYFKHPQRAKKTQAELVLLEKALENFDFAFLRTQYPELAGHTDAKVSLKASDPGLPKIFINTMLVDQSGVNP